MKPIIICTLLLSTTAAHADSLFPVAGTTVATSSLFSDTKARRVGDTLTILVNENATASSKAATSSSKSENLNYGPGFGPLLSNIKNFGLTGGINSTGQGSTTRADNLSAQIAVVVKDVLPNGNLLVEGHRSVGMNAETQQLTLSGIVRPVDIAPDNTVPSALVADAQIKLTGKGPVGDKQHDGIITRIFKVLF